jgi:hypothetical protein
MQTQRTAATRHFSGTYVEARAKFLEAAAQRGAAVESFVLEAHRGALGEELATDVALIGAKDAKKVLLVTSGTHGPEGFCGSGAQVATLNDADLLNRLEQAGVALLLVHAVNPHGFSHLHRTNEDNIDLNRNHIDFNAPLPVNAGYAEVEPLVLPATWPPTAADDAAVGAYIGKHGMTAFRAAVTKGQYTSPDGLFYGGTAPSWSNKTIRAILRKYAASATHLGWIDVHTGLGPYGHGEKIYPGRNTPEDLRAARAARRSPSCTSGPAKPMNSSASEVSKLGPAWRSQLFSAYLVQRIALWLPQRQPVGHFVGLRQQLGRHRPPATPGRCARPLRRSPASHSSR